MLKITNLNGFEFGLCSLWISRYYSVPIDAGDFIMSGEKHQNIVNALEIVYSRIHGSHGRACGKLMTTTKLLVLFIWAEQIVPLSYRK